MMQYEEHKEKTLINKENIYAILKSFAKEFKKDGKFLNNTEIIIVGGGSIILNYDFRDTTQDLDVYVNSISIFKNAINKIQEEYNLSDRWLNNDFMRTSSYSSKLREVSKYYCSFNNRQLEVRTIKSEYLIAMKLVSARTYKNDISDIIGIISYMKKNEEEINMVLIKNAINRLYNDFKVDDKLLAKLEEYIELSIEELDFLYNEILEIENLNKKYLLEFKNENPNLLKEDNLDYILNKIKFEENKNDDFDFEL